MSIDRPGAQADLSQVAGAIPSGKLSTKYIMETLCAAQYGVPNDMRDSAVFKGIVVMEAIDTHLNNDAAAPSQINEALATIDHHIKSLSSNARVTTNMQFATMFSNLFFPLKDEAFQILDKQQALLQKIREHAQKMSMTFEQILEKYKTAGTSFDASAAQQAFNDMLSSQKALKKETTTLLTNLHHTEGKLLNLQKQTSTATMTAGTQIQPGSTPQPN